MNNTASNTPQELVGQAISACQNLSEFLAEENIALQEKNIKKVEQGIKEKRRLAASMESLLKDIHSTKNTIKKDPTAAPHLQTLQVSVNNYETYARKNMILLKSAHEATAGFLNMVRQAIATHKPQARTYGKDGNMTDKSVAHNIVNKSI